MTAITILGREVELRQKIKYEVPPLAGMTPSGISQVMDTIWNETHQWLWAVIDTSGFDWSPVNDKGRLSRRISAAWHKAGMGDLSATALAKIGSISANDKVGKGSEYTFDITDQFDWWKGDFGDPSSCYWGEYRTAKSIIRANGGLAIRFYADRSQAKILKSSPDYIGFGRAWIVPYEKYAILFNGYGFSGDATKTIAKIMSSYLGVTEQPIHLANHGQMGDGLYINGTSGYALAPQSILQDKVDHDFDWNSHRAKCEKCKRNVDLDKAILGEWHNAYHPRCITNSVKTHCLFCHKLTPYKTGNKATTLGYADDVVCDECYTERTTECPSCHQREWRERMFNTVSGGLVCRTCRSGLTECFRCSQYGTTEEVPLTQVLGRREFIPLCDGCRRRNYSTCNKCHRLEVNRSVYDVCDNDGNRASMCADCAQGQISEFRSRYLALRSTRKPNGNLLFTDLPSLPYGWSNSNSTRVEDMQELLAVILEKERICLTPQL